MVRLVLSICTCHITISGTILNASETAGCEVSFLDCPGNIRMFGKYVMSNLKSKFILSDYSDS